eukprot:m.786596 g.786596  ORF g.786596 m.786596 type:complete len:56 (-) comp23305_c1_seq66:1404-1571(-)
MAVGLIASGAAPDGIGATVDSFRSAGPPSPGASSLVAEDTYTKDRLECSHGRTHG